MKNKFIVFYTVLVSLIYIFAVSYFGYNISTEYKYGTERSKRRFDHMENTIKKASSSQQIENAIGDLDDFAFIKITNNDSIIFTYPESITDIPAETKLIKNYFSKSDNFKIEASIYVLRPITIYSYSKVSFLIIFITTAITILLIVYFNLFNNTNEYQETQIDELEPIEEDSENNIQVEVSDLTTQLNDISSIKSKLEKTEVGDTLNTETEAKQEPLNQTLDSVLDSDSSNETAEETHISETTDKSQEEENNDTPDSQNNKTETLPEDLSKPAEITISEPDASSELKIPTDNSQNENTLEFRLEKELSRAISSEVDLSLLLIRIPDLSMDSMIANQIKNLLIEEFQYKDLIFDFSDDCFAGIKLNTTLDEAIDFADKLNHEISNILTENKVCFIGIAARTLRMVGAKRLILESKEALVHAQQDTDSPIVAFRVDSEKYMKFMEN